jgi:hypothetical protein
VRYRCRLTTGRQGDLRGSSAAYGKTPRAARRRGRWPPMHHSASARVRAITSGLRRSSTTWRLDLHTSTCSGRTRLPGRRLRRHRSRASSTQRCAERRSGSGDGGRDFSGNTVRAQRPAHATAIESSAGEVRHGGPPHPINDLPPGSAKTGGSIAMKVDHVSAPRQRRHSLASLTRAHRLLGCRQRSL